MQEHTQLGTEAITQIQRRIGDSTFLEMARQIALYHHERWDGSGYPHGLRGMQIPLSARIVAIADVYDALAMRRVYKDPYPHEVCVQKIRAEAGRHFDPELIETFLAIEREFREVAERFAAPERPAGLGGRPEPLSLAGERRMTVEQEQMLVEMLDRRPAEEAETLAATAAD